MSTLQQGFLEMSDADFAARAEVDLDTKCKLLGKPPGVLLDGPAHADLAAGTIAYTGARASDDDEARRLDLRGKAAVLSVDLEGSAADVGWAFRDAHAPAATAPREPDGAPSSSVETFHLDLATACDGVPLEAGGRRTWVLAFDVASNPVTTLLGEGEPVDPEVREFLASHRPARWAGPVWPRTAEPYPRYDADDSTPAPPETGVALTIPRVQPGHAGQRLLVHGSFRCPVRAWHRVPPPTEAERRERAAAEADGRPLEPRPTAVVPVHLVLVGDTESLPELLTVHVPTWDAYDPNDLEGAVVSGAFHLDLRQHVALTYQTYAVWTVLDGELSGPSYSALVDPKLLASR